VEAATNGQLDAGGTETLERLKDAYTSLITDYEQLTQAATLGQGC
jgi:hypothetical protein